MIDLKMVWRAHPTITWLIAALMILSLLTISSHSGDLVHSADEAVFLTAQTSAQARWFALCWVVYFLFICIDYHRLREWTWPLYGVCTAMLVGVFFTEPIANVHRWYRIPGLGMSIQPSECGQIATVMAISWYLERRRSSGFSVAFLSALIALIPFLLILRQPDLGSALVILPIVMGLFYVAELHPLTQRLMVVVSGVAFVLVLSIFLGLLSHEGLRPWALHLLKEYQYERLNPGGYHNVAGQSAIALGQLWGSGWRQGSYASQGWLPEPYTDSIFASMSEELGLLAGVCVIGIYGWLCYLGLRVALLAKDRFGQLLAVGLSLYLAIHAMINIGMMVGLLPITGVPLPLMSYGGSASLCSAVALGLIQSIWVRRLLF